jgi:hypothetical protein
MRSALASLAFLTTLAAVLVVPTAAAAQNVPTLAVEQGCRAVAAMDPQKLVTVDRCMAQENSAREELATKWSSFEAADRERCLADARSGSPSYVELLTCVDMAREARALEKRERGGGGTIGR